MPLLTYEEALARVADPARISILLGNGFSRACRDNIFNYTNLYELANFGDREPTLRNLFQAFGTYDFEAVARSLMIASKTVEIYSPESPLLDGFRQDLAKLKEALIEVISRTHPDRPDHIFDGQYHRARRFLSRFNQVFTLNYDLLLYWARLRLTPGQDWLTDDGFRRGIWTGSVLQNVYFLHGALHLMDRQIHTAKRHYGLGSSLVDQVREALENGTFPLFVSEPSAEKKLQRIQRNPYLKACYGALGRVSGSLVILGHSMNDNDSHIFEKIQHSAVSSVLVSVHGDETSEANRRIMANAVAFLGRVGRSIHFFDASTANAW